MSISDFAEAIDTFKEQAGKLPFAVYVDPITLVNTNREEWMRDCKECENLRREIVNLKEQIVGIEQQLDIAQELAKNEEDHAMEAETESLAVREEIASIIGARLRRP